MRPAALRAGLIWVMILALSIYGYTGALLQILGPMHRHAEPAAPPAAELASTLLQPLAGVLATLQQWHQQAQAQKLAFVRESGREARHAQPHVHSHGLFERHHHDGDDATVIALDAHGAGASSSDGLASGATLGSATLPLGLSPGLVIPVAAQGRHSPWPRPDARGWRNAELKLLERPPQSLKSRTRGAFLRYAGRPTFGWPSAAFPARHGGPAWPCATSHRTFKSPWKSSSSTTPRPSPRPGASSATTTAA